MTLQVLPSPPPGPSPTATPGLLLPSPAPARRHAPWRAFVIAFTTLAALLTVGLALVVASFLPGGEMRSLRRAVATTEPGVWERRFEFGVGRLPTFLIQSTLHLLDLEPDARAAIATLHSADVGLYHRNPDAQATDPGQTYERMCTEMERRGWEPAVTVRERGQLIAIFVPARSPRRETRLTAAVVVMKSDELILASAHADLEPLIETVLSSGNLRMPLFARR